MQQLSSTVQVERWIFKKKSCPPQATSHVLAVPRISPCFQVVLGILVAAGMWPTANQSAGESRSQLWCWWSLLLFLITYFLFKMGMMWHHKWRGHLHTAGSLAISVRAPRTHTHTHTQAGRVSVYRGEAWNFSRGQSKDVMVERDLRLWRKCLILLPDLGRKPKMGCWSVLFW